AGRLRPGRLRDQRGTPGARVARRPGRDHLDVAGRVKQHLSALRMLFDWFVTGQILEVNPAHSVRGPKYVVQKGETPVLTVEEARELLDSIPTGIKMRGLARRHQRNPR